MPERKQVLTWAAIGVGALVLWSWLKGRGVGGVPIGALLVPAGVGVTDYNMVIGQVTNGARVQAQAWDEVYRSLGTIDTTLARPTQIGYDTLVVFPQDPSLMIGVGIDGALFFKNGNVSDRYIRITWQEY